MEPFEITKKVLQQNKALENNFSKLDCVRYYFPEMNDAEALAFWIDEIKYDEITPKAMGLLYGYYKVAIKPMDKYTFGKNTSDIAVSENLIADKSPTQIAKVGKVYHFLHTKLAALRDVKNRDQRNYFVDLVRDICFEDTNDISCIKDERTRTFMKNSINGKIVEFKRYYKHHTGSNK